MEDDINDEINEFEMEFSKYFDELESSVPSLDDTPKKEIPTQMRKSSMAWNNDKKSDSNLSWLKTSNNNINTPTKDNNTSNGSTRNNNEENKTVYKYKVGDLVEAIWYEDNQYYKAKLLSLEANNSYNLVFTEYGNEQVTEEKDIHQGMEDKPQMIEKSIPTPKPKVNIQKFDTKPKENVKPKVTPEVNTSKTNLINNFKQMEQSNQNPIKQSPPSQEPKRIGKVSSKFMELETNDIQQNKSSPTTSKQDNNNTKTKVPTPSMPVKQPVKNTTPVKTVHKSEIFNDPELMELIEKTNDFLKNARQKVEVTLKSKPSSLGYSSLANLLAETAVIPLNTVNNANNLFDESFKFFDISENLEKNNPVVLLKYSHCLLRNAVFLKENNYNSQSQELFQKAFIKYNDAFKFSPKIENLKLIIFSKCEAPTLNSAHFLGLYDNGYSELYLRLKGQETLNTRLEYHWNKVLNWGDSSNKGVEVTSLHPIFRYHCFEALRSLVSGIEDVLVDADDETVPPAELLLWMYGNLNKLGKVNEANTIALWILKVSEVFRISSLLNAVDTLKKDIRASYVREINEKGRKNNTVVKINKSDLDDRINRELSEIMYSNDGLCGIVQGIHVEISEEEFERVVQNTANVNISDIDVKELSNAASSSYNLSQLLASSCYECLLVGNAKENEQIAESTRVISEDENSIRLISHLCVNESYEIALSASRALLSFFQNTKNISNFADSGVIEAVIYLLHHQKTQIQLNASYSLLSVVHNLKVNKVMTKYERLLSNTLFDNLLNETGAMKEISFSILQKLYNIKAGEALEQCLRRLRPELNESELNELLKELSDAMSLLDENFVPKMSIPQKVEAVIFKAKKIMETKGDFKEQKKKVEESEKILSELLKIDPKNKEALEFLVTSYITVAYQAMTEGEEVKLEEKSEFISRAMSFIEKAEKICPESPKFKLAFAALFKIGGIVELEICKKSKDSIDDIIKKAFQSFEKVGQKLSAVPKTNVGEKERSGTVMRKRYTTFTTKQRTSDDDDLDSSDENGEVRVPDIKFPSIGVSEYKVEGDFKEATLLELETLFHWGESYIVYFETKNDLTNQILVDKAIKKFEDFLQIKPNDHLVMLKLGEAYMKKAEVQTDSETQQQLYNKAISVYEEDSKKNNSKNNQKIIEHIQKVMQEKLNGPEEILEEIEEVEEVPKPLPEVTNKLPQTNTLQNNNSPLTSGNNNPTSGNNNTTATKSNSNQLNSSSSNLKNTLQNEMKDLIKNSQHTKTLIENDMPNNYSSKTGKLSKQGGGTSIFGRKSWKSRVFLLNENHLNYYSKSTTEKPKGTIHLQRIKDVTICKDSMQKYKKEFIFEIVSADRVLPICAKSAQDMNDWIKCIRNNVSLKRNK